MRIRILIGAGLPLCIACVFYCALHGGIHMPCFFHELTGLYCPGCGSGRAVTALAEGRPMDVFSLNCMLVFMGIPCICVLAHEYVRIVFMPHRLRPVYFSQNILWAAVIILLLFWVLRNIPFFSFLAPH